VCSVRRREQHVLAIRTARLPWRSELLDDYWRALLSLLALWKYMTDFRNFLTGKSREETQEHELAGEIARELLSRSKKGGQLSVWLAIPLVPLFCGIALGLASRPVLAEPVEIHQGTTPVRVTRSAAGPLAS